MRVGHHACPTREQIRAVACPTCGARIDEECFEGACSRDKNHIARLKLAIEVLGRSVAR